MVIMSLSGNSFYAWKSPNDVKGLIHTKGAAETAPFFMPSPVKLIQTA